MVLKPDEVMAAWLLKGGKMLAKTCRECGCPMFEYKGRKFCVVCEEEASAKAEKKPEVAGAAGIPEEPGKASYPGDRELVTPLGEALSSTLIVLCERIAKEPDPERCLVLMNSLKKGIEAMQLLKK